MEAQETVALSREKLGLLSPCNYWFLALSQTQESDTLPKGLRYDTTKFSNLRCFQEFSRIDNRYKYIY